MDGSSEKCANCGKTRSNVASITQWISLGDKCSCGVKPGPLKNRIEDHLQYPEPSQDICRRCGGTISKQSGSLTQWVFRTTACSCSEPDRGSASNSSNSDSIVLESPDEPELYVEPSRFPTQRYVAIELLGSGQQGEVYRAKDRILGRQVCIKLLRTEKLLPEQVIRFQREAQAGGKLTHPNLTTVLDFGLTEHGRPFLVMELCPGIPLSEICSETILPFDLTLEIFRQISDGMQYAHEHGVLHRDLKTSNILVEGIETDTPKVTIIDFGLSGLIDTIDDTGGKLAPGGLLMGTPAYMSPEQANEHQLDERSDVYSVGCIMFEVLTGTQVFDGENAIAILKQQAERLPPSLQDTNPDYEYSDELERLVADLLEKNPAKRIQSMSALSKRICSLQTMSTADPQISDPPALASENDALVRYASASEAVSRTKKTAPLILGGGVVLILCAVTWFAFDSIMSESENIEEMQYRLTNHDFADARWTVASGTIHGRNTRILKQCTEQNLRIADENFSDEDIPGLYALPITCLDLSGTKVSNEGLRNLQRLKRLRGLILARCKNINDDGMALIAGFPNLRVLAVRDTAITDKGVEKIVANPSITSLDLSDLPNVTGKSLVILRELPDLLFLRVGNTSIKPDDFPLFQNLKSLRTVSVANLNLQDSDLDELQKLKLLSLDFSENPKITAARVRKFDVRRYWRLTFENCGLPTEEKFAIEAHIAETTPTPIPTFADAIISDPLRPHDMKPGLYALAYNTRFAEPEFLKRLIKEFKAVKGIPDSFY